MTLAPDRAAFVRMVRAPSVTIEKGELIVRLCRDRCVLDVGCIDHSAGAAIALGPKWLHERIRAVARELVGLDILADDAARLNEIGYRIVADDAERFDLGRTFDVVVCGDIIEHVSNVGLFLRRVRAHMHDGSLAVITTPNPFSIEQAVRAVMRNEIYVNDQHTAWLDPQVMYETASRSGFRVSEFYWLDTAYRFPLTGGWVMPRLANAFSGAVMRMRPLCRRDYAVVLVPVAQLV
jgi:SAM-dependent methyltransferase